MGEKSGARYGEVYRRSIGDPERFWGEAAEEGIGWVTARKPVSRFRTFTA